MTGQMSDTLKYQNEDFNIAGVKGEGLFHPEDVGLTPYSSCTACWRGYVVIYKVEDDNLLLDGLLINSKDKVEISGVKGTESEISFFTHQLSGIGVKIPFTGNLLIGKDFMSSLYVHMGFQKPFTYAKVLELEFKNGRLQQFEDKSQRMKEIREKGEREPIDPESGIDIGKYINDAFSLDYD